MWARKCILVAVAAAASLLARGDVVINEVCYDNSTFADETGDTSSDWIELYNRGPASVNLSAYGVGDSNPYTEASGVALTNYNLPPGGFLVVYANGSLTNDYCVWKTSPNADLIASNSVWRYYSSSSAPVATWKTNTFNDAAWSAGISPIGYNDPKQNMDCATLLGYGGNPASRYPAAYFRRAFNVSNPSVITGLVINARINDGAVVYLNGKEILRHNLPAGTITNATLATQTLSTTNWLSSLVATNGLIQGTNVVAVEVHQASLSSVDLIMDLALTALVNERVPIIHGAFGLTKTGENVHLFSSRSPSVRANKFEAPIVEPGLNKSYGLVADGVTNVAAKIYDRPTPGYSNNTYDQKYQETLAAQTPTFSVPPGVYAANQSVVLNTLTSGYRVYYTMDGSDPRDSTNYVYSGATVTVSAAAPLTNGLAWIRTNPVEITNGVPTAAWMPPLTNVAKAVVLRAIAVSDTLVYCSPETRGTYFIGTSFTNRVLPIISLSTDTNNLFGFTSGLFVPGKLYADSSEGYGPNKWGKPHANYHQDSSDTVSWERPVYMELIETTQSTRSVAQTLGVTMHGGGTRAIPQKTLYLMARLDTYGTEAVNYKLFPEETPSSYKRFLLRNSGNDWYGPDYAGVATMMKDAVFHRIVKGLDMAVMAYRPAVAYVNGEYWGIHNLRESFDKHYLATRYGLEADNCDLLMHEEDPLNNGKVKIVRLDGNKSADEDYEAMINWVQANPVSIAGNYQQLQGWMDVTNYVDYFVAETFFGNTDWPINNCDFWRAHTNQVATCGKYGDTRWRWMLYDLDVSGEKGAAYNMFDYLSSSKMTGGSEPGFLINQLWQNMDFRNQFVNRYANLLNTTFSPERMSNVIASAASVIRPEIERHFRRWGRAYTQAQWQYAVSLALTQYTATRHDVSWQHLDGFFGMGGTGLLTVRNSNAGGAGGAFNVNGVAIETSTDGVTNRAAWRGTFFRSLPVPVRAVPDAGYVFDGWVGTAITNPAPNIFVGAAPVELVARFRLSGAPAYVPTGFEKWQAANYGEQAILCGTAARPESPSGHAGMSNFELYAFGMSLSDGLTDGQRQARASLSMQSLSNRLWVGYTRLNGTFSDVRYTLKIAPSLAAPVAWSNAISGLDLDPVSLTNVLDASTWHYDVRLPAASPSRDTRFFKLEAAPQ